MNKIHPYKLTLYIIIFFYCISYLSSCIKFSKNIKYENADFNNISEYEKQGRIIAGNVSILEILNDLDDKNVVGFLSNTYPTPIKYKNCKKINIESKLDIETIKQLNSNLFLASIEQKEILDKELKEENIKIEYIDLNSYEACLKSIKKIGALTDNTKKAERIIQTIESKTLEARRAINGKKSPRVLLIIGSNGKFMIGTKYCYTGSLLEILKINNIANEITPSNKPYEQVSIDAILELKPDIVLKLQSENNINVNEEFNTEMLRSKLNTKTKIYDLDTRLYLHSRNMKIANAVNNLKFLVYKKD